MVAVRIVKAFGKTCSVNSVDLAGTGGVPAKGSPLTLSAMILNAPLIRPLQRNEFLLQQEIACSYHWQTVEMLQAVPSERDGTF